MSLPCPCRRGDVPTHTTPGATAQQRADQIGRNLRSYWAKRGVTLR